MLVSVNAACNLLGIGRTLAYKLIKDNELEVVKIGHRTLIPRASIEKLIERKMQ